LVRSASGTNSVRVGQDSTSVSLDASKTADLGASTTYTVTVAPPPSRPGPISPSGSVEFFDGGQPIASCLAQKLVNGGATCTVTYQALGLHNITASYGGDTNFTGATSPAQTVRVVRVPVKAHGTITSTMQWAFLYTPSYTKVLALVVNGAATGTTVLVKCQGRGCPYTRHLKSVGSPTPCGGKRKRTCRADGRVDLRVGLIRHRLYPGATITVMITRRGWIGKFYSFSMRARRGPRIQISCIAPGGVRPGVGC
jgi:hypothetical protein